MTSTEMRKSLCKTYLSRTQAGPGRGYRQIFDAPKEIAYRAEKKSVYVVW